MFVKTIRFNKKTAVAGVVIAAVLLTALVLTVSNGKSGTKHSIFDFGTSLRTDEGRAAYLMELGWEVDAEPLESKSVLIPKEFGEILTQYNSMQTASGYDLSDYAGLTVEQYTYRVTNYENAPGDVNATIYVYNGQIIGGDIHSTAVDGFMHGLK